MTISTLAHPRMATSVHMRQFVPESGELGDGSVSSWGSYTVLKPVTARRSELLLLLTLAAASAAAQDFQLPVPDRIDPLHCRPINVTSEEMARQWRLYYSHTPGLKRSNVLEAGEAEDARDQRMATTALECYVGSELFAALCFFRANTATLHVQSVKLVHSPKGGNCISIVSVTRR